MLSQFRSLWRFLTSLFGPSSPAQQHLPLATRFNPDPDYRPSLEDVPRYPPFDRGLPFITVDDLLESQRTLVDRVRDSRLPYADEAVRNLASYVHLLPATSNDFFCGAGGLFRLCLEIGFHSYVASQGNIFTSRDPAEKRRELEAKWQLAAFLAGMCCELSRAIVTSVVTNDHGDQWLPFEPITGWLQRTNTHRYFLRPPQTATLQSHDTEHLSGVIVNAIIPAAALQHITTEDRNILMSMLSTITRLTESYNKGQFPRTVRHVRDQVIHRDKRSNPLTFGKPLVGVHVEPYLINAMRHLVRDRVWKVNEKLARVHIGPDGAYVFWTTGVQEILKLLREEGVVGIHSDPRTLGELLMREGIFEMNAQEGLWWYVKTPLASTVHEVVKLSNPGLILDDDTLASVQIYPSPIAVDPPPSSSSAASSDPPVDSTPSTALIVHAVSEPVAQSPSPPPRSAPAAPVPPGSKDYSKVLAISATGSRSDSPSAPKASSESSPAKPPADRPQKSKPKAPSTSKAPTPSAPAVRPPFNFDGEDDDGDSDGSSSSASGAQGTSSDPIAALLKRASLVADFRGYVALHNQALDSSPFFWTDHGLCIPFAFIHQKSDPSVLASALSEAGCLYIKKGETSRYVEAQHNGKNLRCICILTKVATDFGFRRSSPASPPSPSSSDDGLPADLELTEPFEDHP